MWTCNKCNAEVDDEFEVCWSCGTSVTGVEDPAFRRIEPEETVAASVNEAVANTASAAVATAAATAPVEVPAAPADTPPAEPPATTEKLVTVATYHRPEQAERIHDRLEQEGLSVFVAYDFVVPTDRFLDNAACSIQLQVAEADVEKARGILAEIPIDTKFPPEPSASLSPQEYLRALEHQLSTLMDEREVPGWKVNPAFHPDVAEFIQKYANNSGFLQKAQALQRNRASYYVAMRTQAEARRKERGNLVVFACKWLGRKSWELLLLAVPLLRFLGRWLKRIVVLTICLLVLVVALALVASIYLRVIGEERLQAAIDEADEKDPVWRWDEMEARRSNLPDNENGALQVLAAAETLPERWPADLTVLEEVHKRSPAVQFDEHRAQALRAELERLGPALKRARALANLPSGRYPSQTVEERISTTEASFQASRRVAELLWVDAALLAADRKADAALTSARAQLNAGRAIGDEPDMLAQLVRFSCQHLACTSIERTLAQGEPAEEALANTQRLLEQEAGEAALLYALRGARAYSHEARSLLTANDIEKLHPNDADKVPAVFYSQSVPGQVEHWLKVGWVQENHGMGLEMLTEAVEITKQKPIEEQALAFKALDIKYKMVRSSDWLGVRYYPGMGIVPAVIMIAQGGLRRQAELRCTVAAVAVERYRLANGRWPVTLDQAVPKFLAAVPLDPFGGQPLRCGKLADSLVIYSIGPDESDNEGNLTRTGRHEKGTDLGCRLWDVQHRRQSPAAKPAAVGEP